MAIHIACPGCTKRLKGKDELAGKQVRCPGCGFLISVPASESVQSPSSHPSPPPAYSVLSMPATISCACGYRREVPDEFGGKRVRCPKCGSVFRVPTNRPSDGTGARGSVPSPARQHSGSRGTPREPQPKPAASEADTAPAIDKASETQSNWLFFLIAVPLVGFLVALFMSRMYPEAPHPKSADCIDKEFFVALDPLPGEWEVAWKPKKPAAITARLEATSPDGGCLVALYTFKGDLDGEQFQQPEKLLFVDDFPSPSRVINIHAYNNVVTRRYFSRKTDSGKTIFVELDTVSFRAAQLYAYVVKSVSFEEFDGRADVVRSRLHFYPPRHSLWMIAVFYVVIIVFILGGAVFVLSFAHAAWGVLTGRVKLSDIQIEVIG